MIAQNQQKVKKEIIRVVQKAGKSLTEPERKFVLEMMTGMLATGQSNLTRIAGVLKEGIAVKNTLKRLQRMSSHERILEAANRLSLQEAKGKVTAETVLALDDGDITHQYGRVFECQSRVYDGSAKDTKPGYNLNQVSGYNQSSGETFPILLDIYSLAGVKRMFLFRWKRRARKALLITIPPMLPFLAKPTALAYALEYGL